jgi:acetylacetone-cleaving enzyme
MTFTGPLVFINPDGSPIAVVGWEEVQAAWEAFLSAKKAA